MKNATKQYILPVILCLIPIALGLYVYPQLPEQIPSHWGLDGTVDGYMSKAKMVFGMPVFMAVMTVFMAFMLTHDPKKRNQAGAMKAIALWTCPVLSLLLVPMSLFIALGYQLPVANIVCGFVGVLFVLIGNYLPKSKQNYTMGIRLPWTLNSEENWNRTHRFAGKVWVVGGAMMALGACVMGQSSWFAGVLTGVLTGVIVVISALPMVYSYRLYRKGV